MIIRMEYHLYDELVKWAKEHLPEEACGLLAGTEEDIALAYDSKANYMILSLMAEHPVVNVFHIEAGEWIKEDLRIYSEEYYF